MISRSLGPEFGGSIGLMFFLAKVCACGEYVLGLVEAILDVFGADPGELQYALFSDCIDVVIFFQALHHSQLGPLFFLSSFSFLLVS